MDVPVTVEITKLSPGDIETCVIRPISRQLTPVISNDKAFRQLSDRAALCREDDSPEQAGTSERSR
jgi:hypothetical protein